MVKGAEWRKRKYEAGINPEVIGGHFARGKEGMVRLESTYFPQIALVESEVKRLVEAAGVPTFEVAQYVNVGRKCYSIAKNFGQATRDAEAQRVVDHWAARGLDGELLRQACVAGGCHPEAPSVEKTIFISGEMTYFGGSSWSQWQNLASGKFPDGVNGSEIHINLRVPDDFLSLVSVRVVLGVEGAGGVGDLKHQDYASFGAVGETPTLNWTAWLLTPVTRNVINLLPDLGSLLPGLARGDYVGLAPVRNGADAEDTVDQHVHILGVLFTYRASP